MSNFIELILTVCTLSQPVACGDRKLVFDSDGGSPNGCMMRALPTIARWAGEHPGVEVTRWRCSPPGASDENI